MEELYSISEEKPVVCPQCGKKTLKQEIGMPSNWHPHPCTFNGRFPLTPAQKEAKWKNNG